MSTARLFTKLGVFVREHFLDADECAALRAEMRTSPCTAASVAYPDRPESIDPGLRKTGLIRVAPPTRAAMVRRLLALKPAIECHFKVALADVIEPPKFLIYRDGDYFGPHMDRRAPHPDAAPLFSSRRVNMIVYLNGESPTPGPDVYDGAALTLYGLIDRPAWRRYGFAITGRPGLLIAFPSDVVHEVTPIVRGERYNIVSRFLDAGYQPDTSSAQPGGD